MKDVSWKTLWQVGKNFGIARIHGFRPGGWDEWVRASDKYKEALDTNGFFFRSNEEGFGYQIGFIKDQDFNFLIIGRLW